MPVKFVVPQFIDKEDRILGPITVRQFLIILVATGLAFLEYYILTTAFFILFFVFTTGISLTFAFLKINGQSFHFFFLNFLQTNLRPKLRVWNKNLNLSELTNDNKKVVGLAKVAQVSAKRRIESSKLRSLVLTVNTGGAYKDDDLVEDTDLDKIK